MSLITVVSVGIKCLLKIWHLHLYESSQRSLEEYFYGDGGCEVGLGNTPIPISLLSCLFRGIFFFFQKHDVESNVCTSEHREKHTTEGLRSAESKTSKKIFTSLSNTVFEGFQEQYEGTVSWFHLHLV